MFQRCITCLIWMFVFASQSRIVSITSIYWQYLSSKDILEKKMFDILVKFLNALYPDLHYFLIGCSTDGARSMIGRIRGLATRMSECTSTMLIHIWYGIHQIDLIMQKVFKSALDDTFHSKLTTIIGYLRHHQNHIKTIRSTCPKVSDVRWVSMDSCSTWSTSNIICIQKHFNLKRPSCTLDITWWNLLFAIHDSKIVFDSLQRLTTLLS